MELNNIDDFDAIVFTAAKLRTTEVAALHGVHRVSVSRWRNSRQPPNKFVRPVIIDFLARVTKAVEEGTLPVPQGIRGRERLRYIRNILGL